MYEDLTSATVLRDSVGTGYGRHRLTTLQVTFPRFILAEFNTHRAFSRNSASSRAIPVEKQLAAVEDHPFVPRRWPVNRPGMSAVDYIEQGQFDYMNASRKWLEARDQAIETARYLNAIGVHKQIANRVLEPFMWHTAIVSATEWANWFHLRDSPEAQPEIAALARAMREAMEASTPEVRHLDDRLKGWHLPLVGFGEDYQEHNVETLVQLSVARCARVSYLTHDGHRDVQADLKLYHRLRDSGHLSPFEHAAQLGYGGVHYANYQGWVQHRWTVEPGFWANHETAGATS